MISSHLSTFGYRHQILCGRGTTALWLAVRSIVCQYPDQPVEIVIPDLLCSTILDGILLAGAVPRFAAVSVDRYTVTPTTIAAAITTNTRAILVAHLFGHVVDIPAIRVAAPHLPIIEDAVQGLGGVNVGTAGDLSFLSFDPTKMIGGHGGVLMLNDDSLADLVRADLLTLEPDWSAVRRALSVVLDPAAAKGYELQLRLLARNLLRTFDNTPANVNGILADWQTLPLRVTQRNEKALWLQESLSDLSLTRPAIYPTDSIWRYTFAAQSSHAARRIAHALARSGVLATKLYTPLSRLLGQNAATADLASKLINLWVDDSVDNSYLQRAIQVIRSHNNPANSC
ncbi:MAG: DegT/DnrJ/EryC1/StrS family aminotransferase [Anaerolineae bacterium]|nr:DegT/DnrJ/EryC1/StrS family aminotransferase [Anaerolineae bacterium]